MDIVQALVQTHHKREFTIGPRMTRSRLLTWEEPLMTMNIIVRSLTPVNTELPKSC